MSAILDTALSPRRRTSAADPVLMAALERASGAIARLDQALDGHPLLPAILYRTRLEAVRRQAAVDGSGIDPWHMAATLEGLRLRMDHALRIIDRCDILEAARTALSLHQWIVEPDFDQEGEVQAAEHHLASAVGLVGIGEALWTWLDHGGTRAPARAALIRLWSKRRLIRAPVPLTGPRALAAEAPQEPVEWTIAFLDALASEATDYVEMVRSLEHGWAAARARVPSQRSTSRAALAVDVLAAAPLLSATTLARAIGMSVKCAGELLERFVEEEIAVEVTHRSARRLFGLSGMAPVRDATTAPRRPLPGRGRGRPPFESEWLVHEPAPPAPSPSISRFERPAIDYSGLEAAMAHCDEVVRSTRRRLQASGSGP